MSWTYISESKPTAKKQYNCFLCGESIFKGEKHLSRTGADNGKIYSFRTHFECNDETLGWNRMDWESFSEGEMKRPGQQSILNLDSKEISNL